MRHCSCVLGAFSSFPHVALTIFETSAQSLLRKLLRSKAWNLSLFWIRVSHWVMTLNICCFPLLPDNNKIQYSKTLSREYEKTQKSPSKTPLQNSVFLHLLSTILYNSLQNFRTRTNPKIERKPSSLFPLLFSPVLSSITGIKKLHSYIVTRNHQPP